MFCWCAEILCLYGTKDVLPDEGKRVIGEGSVSQTDSNQMVCLVIPELKELTGTLEEH